MDDKRRTRISKFLSLVLRHQPQTAGLTLEPGGWVPIDALLSGAAATGMRFTRDELEEVVEACDKQRFAIDPTDTKIRANQGHSAEVDLQLLPAEPPAELFHGTPERNLAAVRPNATSRPYCATGYSRWHATTSTSRRTLTPRFESECAAASR